ncbi:OmpA family protein [Myxococcus sp. CA056]|uniref:OmpA family protein n=1 Tax=unclassified Myxococcus TaxID=2648731 RepID=UPI00157ADEE3|nr:MULTISPECIES: OmpA family protein [unclassified Myxococcus]NTX11822.1 OmpA family protein [Myxococcus sp. CA056]NTX34076.1 OmpA family protein [Myxococcus sp. CA033]
MSHSKVTARKLTAGLGLPTGEAHTLVLKRRAAVVVELDDLNFHSGSAVLLPAPHARENWRQGHTGGLTCVIRALEYALEKKQTLLVAGHTDSVGGDGSNRALSKARAQNVHDFLTGDKAGWASSCAEHTVQDYQTVLTWVADEYGWNCDPGGIDGQHGKRTTAALEAFRKAVEAAHGSKPPDSRAPGVEDWKAVFQLYETYVAGRVDLKAARGALSFATPAVLGCGEDWPIEGQGQDNLRSQVNRRVELVFFEEPPPDFSRQSPPGAQLYGAQGGYQRSYLPITPRHTFFFSV